MRLALLSDVHSNLEALQTCLAHARAHGAEQYAFLGDLVGYGADPVACLDMIEDLSRQGGIVVRGNHDEAVLSGLCDTMEITAREAIYWTRAQLGARQRAFLQSLPMMVKDADACYVHASADRPGRWTYILEARQAARSMSAAQTVFTFSGHVHEPALYYTGQQSRPQVFHPTSGVPVTLSSQRQWLVIPGSVGQPRDGDNAACCAIMDRRENTLTYFRLPYDYASAAKKIVAAGLPPQLALRLEQGR